MNGESSFLKQLNSEIRVKSTWTKDELELKIRRKIDAASEQDNKPRVRELRLYDFFSYKLLDIPHPCVIFRIEDGIAWGIITSSGSTEGPHLLSKIENSRQIDGWWTNTVIVRPVEECIKSWLGVFENAGEVRRAVKLIRQHYKNVLK